MKTSIKYVLPVLTVAGLALMIVHRSAADPTIVITPPAPPTVVVSAPAPVVVAAVPDYYVWDGYEYVGVVGDQYYYLGPGDVWIVCDPVRLGRFHTWEKGHADWRTHAIHNVKYRNVDRAHAQPQPMHDAPGRHMLHSPLRLCITHNHNMLRRRMTSSMTVRTMTMVRRNSAGYLGQEAASLKAFRLAAFLIYAELMALERLFVIGSGKTVRRECWYRPFR